MEKIVFPSGKKQMTKKRGRKRGKEERGKKEEGRGGGTFITKENKTMLLGFIFHFVE